VTGYLLLITFGRKAPVGAFLADHFGIVFSFRWTGAALACGIMAFPLMVRAIRLSIEAIDRRLEDAAATLGANRAWLFLTVTLPLALPGLISGAVLVFIPAVGEYVIPELVGNSSTIMIGGILWEEFFQNRDWPLAAAIAIATFLLLMIPSYVLRRWLGPLGTVKQ